MNKFFNYSGSKIKFVNNANELIDKSNGSIYVEPFLGSGAVFCNLNKEFDRYILNDSCPHIYSMWYALDNSDYNDYLYTQHIILNLFGNIKDSKEAYYEFRKWYNINFHFHKESEKMIIDRTLVQKGLYLYFLANSCINGMLRFGPNGMNQGWGNRGYFFDESTFDSIKKKLVNADIFNDNGFDFMDGFKDQVLFLDPPYMLRPSSYEKFDEEKLLKFIKLIETNSKNNDIIYTDCESEYMNKEIFNSFIIRKMKNTCPSKKCEETLNEVCYHNLKLDKVLEF